MEAKIKKQMKFLSDLSNVKRYSQFTMCHSESVLEHSASVTMLCYFIGRLIEEEGVIKVNFGVLLEKSIFHDADESITGDITRPIKYHSEKLRKMLGEMEDECMCNLSEEITGEGTMYSSWREAKNGPEGSIVSLCDVLSVLHKIHDEVVNRKNITMKIITSRGKLLENIHNKIKRINSIYGPIEKLHEVFMECEMMVHNIDFEGVQS